MARTAPITIKATDLPAVETAIAEAVAAERRRLLAMVRATCACQRCKDDVAALLNPGGEEL